MVAVIFWTTLLGSSGHALGQTVSNYDLSAHMFDHAGTFLPELSILEEIRSFAGQTVSNHQFISSFEAKLWPLFSTLPKTASGGLSEATAGYALHRYFSQQYGWSVHGLPNGLSDNRRLALVSALQGGAPEYVLTFLDDLLQGQGLSLSELAVFTALLEHLIVKDMVLMLERAYQAHSGDFAGSEKTEKVLQTYLMFTVVGSDVLNVAKMLAKMHEVDPHWNATVAAIGPLRSEIRLEKDDPELCLSNAPPAFDAAAGRMAVLAINSKLVATHQGHCEEMTAELLPLETSKHNGRVRVADFHSVSSDGMQRFVENVNYLSDLGVLDESNPEDPRVVIPNYLEAKSNCVMGSGFVQICCPRKCSALMDKLEESLGGASLSVADVAGVLAEATSIDDASELPVDWHSRLGAVAVDHKNDSRVHLHGRSFAMLLHEAFSRICPVPHAFGVFLEDQASVLAASVVVVAPNGEVLHSVGSRSSESVHGQEEGLVVSNTAFLDSQRLVADKGARPSSEPAGGMSWLHLACMFMAASAMTWNLAKTVRSATSFGMSGDEKNPLKANIP